MKMGMKILVILAVIVGFMGASAAATYNFGDGSSEYTSYYLTQGTLYVGKVGMVESDVQVTVKGNIKTVDAMYATGKVVKWSKTKVVVSCTETDIHAVYKNGKEISKTVKTQKDGNILYNRTFFRVNGKLTEKITDIE